MKVLLTGVSGQLGKALIASKPPCVELVICGRSELDLAKPSDCQFSVYHYRPNWVLNAGAYTAVDKAETEPNLAYLVNAEAPAAFAKALADTGGLLLQVSTDFVFDGKQGFPYRPDQTVCPLGVYGASKAEGEYAALKLPGARVLRTSWVYGPFGNNFLKTMLRGHRQGDEISVVSDQVSCPTSINSLALACWRAIGVGLEDSSQVDLPRILHWSDAGVASWYDFATAIGELGVATGLIDKTAHILPISTSKYPLVAVRPSYSLLDCTSSRDALGLWPLHWRAALQDILESYHHDNYWH